MGISTIFVCPTVCLCQCLQSGPLLAGSVSSQRAEYLPVSWESAPSLSVRLFVCVTVFRVAPCLPGLLAHSQWNTCLCHLDRHTAAIFVCPTVCLCHCLQSGPLLAGSVSSQRAEYLPVSWESAPSLSVRLFGCVTVFLCLCLSLFLCLLSTVLN